MMTDDEILEDLRSANEDVGGNITETEYREKARFYGYASLKTVKRRFESFNDAKDKAGLGTEKN